MDISKNQSRSTGGLGSKIEIEKFIIFVNTVVAVVTISEDLIENSCDEARTQNYLSSTQGVLISHMSNLQKPLNNKQRSKNNSN